MGDQLKFIVTELKKPPWEKNYSVISFDSLSSEQLLQVLTDVLGEIDVKNKVDIREEDPERMAVRFLSMLRGLKYRPPDVLAQNFRRRLIEGDKIVVHSVLQWILERPLGELKRRAYLAKYLVRVEIPPEALADAEVDALNKQVLYLNHAAVGFFDEAKRSLMSTDEGFSDTPPEGEALREYITSQNARSAFCKQKRAQLAALIAEVGVLVRTQEVLLAMEEDLNGNLVILGIIIFHVFDWTELRQMREKYQDLKVSYDKKKRLHDSLTAGIESEVSKVEQWNRRLGEEVRRRKTWKEKEGDREVRRRETKGVRWRETGELEDQRRIRRPGEN
ncbi:hypothetical protein J437_LFUL006144 [Ladona fulva]|uniref:Intraflagellar transport protein 81 homolog n=1 Tax=Ladona fulva TaxID=123851 RepID=A0A8K0JYR1_LADFU|nr:hypothetical protein J437_LFUL006144 [Ladona fulva]